MALRGRLILLQSAKQTKYLRQVIKLIQESESMMVCLCLCVIED